MKILEINGDEGVVEMWGVRKTANLSLIENPEPGNYVLIHAGFALQLLNEHEANETLKLYEEMIAAAETREAQDRPPEPG